MSASAELREQRRVRREAALARRAGMSPSGPAPDRFRVATWNVNSLRARTPSLGRLLARARPDVVLLQETKASTVKAEPAALFHEHGYAVVHAGDGPYNGVAIASLHPLRDVEHSGMFDNEHLDREPRVISAVLDAPRPLRVVSVYVPHGREVGHAHYEYKLAFLAALRARVGQWLERGSLLLGGDINVAPTDSDIFHPDAFVGLTHVTGPERAAMQGVLDMGLVDLDARQWGAHERRFTWWNHGMSYARNLGMRIDLLASDETLATRLVTTWIDHTERGSERPSDHAALLADFVLDAG